MQGWKQKLLSQAGREVLIKSVIQAIPTYAMQCFRHPTSLLNKLMVYVRRFFWGGFRDFEAFNTALLAKQGWRLLTNPDAFWGRILKGIYFPNSNFLVAKKGSHPSWLWSSLLHGRDLLLHGLRWQVGNGRNIYFWTHKWVPFSKDFYIRSPLGPFHNGNTVADFIEDGEWNVRLLREHISATEAEMVLQIPISRTGSTDKLVWHFDPTGQ
ncbi:hypothetical protein Tco_0679652 [Tanacetum coccineum]|uniref:Uncharacterized protein n=1 Tax=Tanacetum coccineum TaxID=301880 RepID=A0ABQ4XJG4_9ASTR